MIASIKQRQRLFRDQSGSIAVMMALLLLPVLLAVGLAIDYARYSVARSRLQDLTDGVSLALAASREKDEDKLRAMAQAHIAAHAASTDGMEAVRISNLKPDNDQIDLALKSTLKTVFMGLADIDSLSVETSALSMRAVTGSVEVALVLDNTWSMSDEDGHGVAKIDTLKTAAASLVNELMENRDSLVRIGLVPYADYVNVGTQHRHASWLEVADDYTVEPEPETCKTLTTRTVCLRKHPTYSCTKVVDGVSEPATCGGGCAESESREVEPYQSCTGGGRAKQYSWHGCVGSRKPGTARLDDQSPSVRYPGYVETSQKCLNSIVPLSTDKAALLDAIDGMIINIGSSYKPYTYIPAGLIWGQNLLSPAEPFSEGAAYDAKNVSPRKVAVLMTDGDNTLRFRSSDGRHIALSSNAATAETQVAKTNQDTAAICDYMKSNNIEIFTVAFMVTNADAKALLEGCASDAEHYYDASDPETLLAAFSGIAR